MKSSIVRVVQRYLVPSFVTSIYVFLRYRCIVSTKARIQLTGRITFGKGTVVKPFAIIQTSAGKGIISIGRNCAISSFNHISTGEGDILIGDNVRTGSSAVLMGIRRNVRNRDALIVDQGFSHRGLKIGNDVLIGANAVVIDGCDIGEGAVVGAGSVVAKPVAPYTIVAGIPAEKIGERG